MTRENYQSILDDAQANGLQIIETTDGNNGYPSNLRDAVMGFEDFDEAERYAEANGLRLIELHRRDGWNLWQRGDHANAPFDLDTIYSRDREFDCYDDARDFFSSILEGLPYRELNDMDELEDYIRELREMYDEFAYMGDDEFLVVLPEGYEVKPKHAMEDYYDTHHYAIAAIYEGEFNDDDEEDD
jgi:hypothetical protein